MKVSTIKKLNGGGQEAVKKRRLQVVTAESEFSSYQPAPIPHRFSCGEHYEGMQTWKPDSPSHARISGTPLQ
jgi:hypothetical protein